MHVLSLEAGMRRREFFGVAGGALTWPLAATAQPSTKLPTIGFFSSDYADDHAAANGRVRAATARAWLGGRPFHRY